MGAIQLLPIHHIPSPSAHSISRLPYFLSTQLRFSLLLCLFLHSLPPSFFETNLHFQAKGIARGEGGNPPPRETEKIVVEKLCYFRMLYL